MPLYFFDTRDDDIFSQDDEGVDYADIEAAAIEASRSLVELARDIIPGTLKRVLVVEVRDSLGPVLTAAMRFEAVLLRSA